MKSFPSRLLAAAVLAVLGWLVLAGASAPKSSSKAPDQLVVLSTTDVKGEVKPCG